jgi:hypothetical protein
MAQTIRLHGGPWHGQLTAVEDGRDHFHIIEALPDFNRYADSIPTDGTVPTREGMYSRIHDSKTEFEWDGWRSHD